MEKCEMFGLLVRQAREEKGWTQQELADQMGIDQDTVTELEEGSGNPSMEMMAGYFFLLNISPNITVYEDTAEDALRLNRIYRELQVFSQEQIDRLYNSVTHIKKWHKDHPDVVTLDDYWKSWEYDDSEEE